MKMTREAGKGDAPRKDADQEAYSAGWDRIFKNNKTICEPSSDRRLLEAAASAAGIEYDKKVTEKDYKYGLWLTINGEPYDGQRRKWNPLTDDGDALRLAVKLNMDILQDPIGAKENEVWVVACDVKPWALEKRSADHYAATRRAIVRVAAKMGAPSVSW